MTAPTLQPPLFDAQAPLETVLTWEGLPNVLRRALTRSISPDALERMSFIDSLGSTDPRFREWLVGLLALDIGVDLEGDRRDNLIGVFSKAALGTEAMNRFCVHGVGPQQGYGASFRASSPTAPASVCAAAFVYFTDKGLVESEFVFIAATSTATVQLPIPMLRGAPLEDAGIERALTSVAKHLVEFSDRDETRGVVREALLECRRALATAPRQSSPQH